jgi:hypothetical protein
MIDKLEVRVPESISFTNEFKYVFAGIKLNPARHYGRAPLKVDRSRRYLARHLHSAQECSTIPFV